MPLVIKRSGGLNIALRNQALPRYYPASTTHPQSVEVYWRMVNEDGTVGGWNLHGTFAPGAKVSIPYNPAKDQHVQAATRSFSSSGVPDVISLNDAVQATLLHVRETNIPEIGQNKPATDESVEIGITNFNLFARLRRVTVSANADMSSPLEVILLDSDDYASKELPRYFILSRSVTVGLTTEAGDVLQAEDGSPLDLEVLPATVYVTVAHNGGTAWTGESNILMVTFTAADGSGSTDPPEFFDPIPRDRERLEEII